MERNSGVQHLTPIMLALGLLTLGACTLKKGEPSGSELQRAVARWNATAEPRERIICRRESTPDSHFKTRVCRYQWQLDEGRLEARAALDELNYNSARLTDQRRE